MFTFSNCMFLSCHELSGCGFESSCIQFSCFRTGIHFLGKFGLKNQVCENKHFCNIVMPSEDTKISEFNQYQNFEKTPIIIYADLNV